jgi:hypothetical protein
MKYLLEITGSEYGIMYTKKRATLIKLLTA